MSTLKIFFSLRQFGLLLVSTWSYLGHIESLWKILSKVVNWWLTPSHVMLKTILVHRQILWQKINPDASRSFPCLMQRWIRGWWQSAGAASVQAAAPTGCTLDALAGSLRPPNSATNLSWFCNSVGVNISMVLLQLRIAQGSNVNEVKPGVKQTTVEPWCCQKTQ